MSTSLQSEVAVRREPGTVRASLRSALLFNLAGLAAAAVLLALWTIFLLQLPLFRDGLALWFFLLIGLDLLLFVLLGRLLLDRFVVRPLKDQLLQNQSRLAENIRSLDRTNRKLVDTQRELIHFEKLASIGRLAAGVAHEVGNPLGAMIGYLAVLRNRGADAELLDGMERESRRIDRIVLGLLDFARPPLTDLEPVDLNGSIRRVVAMLREQGRLARVEVQLDLAEDLPPIRAVPHVVDQLWVNLFINADAAMQGEGRLHVTTRRLDYRPARQVPVRRADDPPGIDYSHLRRVSNPTGPSASRIEPGTDVVEVCVADTGPGVPPEVAESIFDPFFTTKPPGEGTGLGLAIVTSTVAELRGSIELAMRDGRGATFVVSLPTGMEAD